MQLHFYLAFTDGVPLGDFANGIPIEIPAQENPPTFLGKLPEKRFQGCLEGKPVRNLSLPEIRDTLLQLRGQSDQPRIPLGGPVPVQPVEGQIPANPSQKGEEILWSLRRDGLPGQKVGVTDGFL